MFSKTVGLALPNALPECKLTNQIYPELCAPEDPENIPQSGSVTYEQPGTPVVFIGVTNGPMGGDRRYKLTAWIHHQKPLFTEFQLRLTLLLAVLGAVSCRSRDTADNHAPPGQSNLPVGSQAERGKDCQAREAARRPRIVPQSQIVAGDGIGWNCLGDAPTAKRGCVVTHGDEVVCREFADAHELYFERGVLSRIRVHRAGRLVPASFPPSERTPSTRDGGKTFPTWEHRIGEVDTLGKPTADILATLPAPTTRTTEQDPEFGPITRYSYPGLDLEAETVDGRELVGAVVVHAK